MWVWRSIFTGGILGRFCELRKYSEPRTDALQGFHWRRFLDFLAALLAGTAHIVIPEIEHRLTEMLNNVCAVEMDVFHQCSAIVAVKNNVLFFSWRPAPSNPDPNSLRRPWRRVRHIRRDKECFAFSDNVVHDTVAFANAHLDVAFSLVENT